jgi:ribosomal protein S18 acetylase RimI-like enzyme
METDKMATLVREPYLDDSQAAAALIRELGEMDGYQSGLNAEQVRQFLEIPGNCILLADVDGQVAGLLSYTVSFDLWHAGDCCLIRELIIHAGKRRQGLGDLLLQELFQRAERGRWMEVSVSTMPDNLAAIAFYKKHGLTDEAVMLERHF